MRRALVLALAPLALTWLALAGPVGAHSQMPPEGPGAHGPGAGGCGGGRGSALAYQWPVAPFDEPHPVRGNFGDPRTLYWGPAAVASLGGSFTFHNGIDISASPGTPVYPVLSGRVLRTSYEVVVVRTGARRFQYWHVHPLVAVGQHVVAHETVLGRVFRELDHVHLSEIDGTTVVNPLEPGHLTPYRKHTRPVVRGIAVRSADGPQSASDVHGRIWLIADAYDFPALVPPPPWGERPVAPALIAWELRNAAGVPVVRHRVAVDFRRHLPRAMRFWRVYAAGSYQNRPVVGRTLERLPGRYLFDLVPAGLDVDRFRDGRYRLTVSAADVCGNRGSLTLTITIRNTHPPRTPLADMHARRV